MLHASWTWDGYATAGLALGSPSPDAQCQPGAEHPKGVEFSQYSGRTNFVRLGIGVSTAQRGFARRPPLGKRAEGKESDPCGYALI